MSKLVKIEYIIFFLMAEPSIHDIISKNFSAASKDEWIQAAKTEIPENISLENLLWTVDGLVFSPYYMKEDLKQTAYLQSFHHLSHRSLSHSWLNMPEIRVIEERKANEKSLRHLQGGADGIAFDITEIQNPDISKILKGVRWDYCPVAFKIADANMVTKIFAYAEEKYDPAKLTGAFWWKQLPETDHLYAVVKQFLDKYKNYHLIGIEVPPSSPTKEISWALLRGVKLVDEMTNLKIDRKAIFHSITLGMACDESIVVNIAKLKAMRMLWYQLSQAFEISDYKPTDLELRCSTRNKVDEKFQPHGNMISNTYQAMSAIIGGTNVITTNSSNDEANDMTDRVALNVSNVLKEESHFDKVADPLAGSYVIEKMVDEFSQAAWADFQKQLS